MYTVVVADDEWEIRRSLIENISWVECGFRVVGEASNGMEALELVEKEKPDLLLTDIRMPFLSGIDLARVAREVQPTIQVAFLSGHEDFTYAQQAIQYNVISYMLKPITSKELVKELNVIRAKIDKQFETIITASPGPLQVSEFFVPLMLGANPELTESRSESSLRTQAIEYGVITGAQKSLNYVVLAINVSDADKRTLTTRTHVGAVTSVLDKYFHSVSGYIGGRILTQVFLEEKPLEEQLDIPLKELVQVFERVLGTSCHIGISGAKNQLLQAHIAYREAVDALDTVFVQSGSIRYASDFAPQHTIRPELFEYVLELERVLKNCDKRTVQMEIDKLFSDVRKGGYSFFEIDMMMSQYLAAVVYFIAVNADAETAARIWSKYPQVYQSYTRHSLEDIHAAVRDFCGMVMDELKKQSQQNGEQLSRKVLEIIRTEYGNENLNLSDIGTRLHVSANYLSQLIRKDTGDSFVKLLTTRRMDSAKKLLETTALKVGEIAAQCGYSDPYYFSHCFKKHFGQTPISLRRAV